MLRAITLFLLITTVYSLERICTDNFQSLNSQKCVRYFDPTEYSTHGNAVRQCGAFGGYPVAINNAIDNNYIAKMGTSTRFWLGLACFGNSASQCFWDDGSGDASGFNQFAPGYPDTSIGQCVTMSTSGSTAGKWYSTRCNDVIGYVCQMPATYPDDTCDFLFADTCFYISDDDATLISLPEAELDCISRGMHLTSIHSPDEFQYLRRAITNIQIAIGARQIADNKFQWIDGTPWDYERPILRNGTDGGCVYIRGWNGLLYDNFETLPCSEVAYRYICRKPIGVSKPLLTPDCNSSLIMAPGVITSPNYPSIYPNNLKCNYQIRCPDGMRIGIMFTDVMTQSGDIITVYNGTDVYSSKIAIISGEQRNQFFYSGGNAMLVTFETDGTKQGFGFRAQLDTYTV